MMIKTEGGNSILLDDTPGIGGITLETAGGQKIKMAPTGIEIDNGMGASIKLTARRFPSTAARWRLSDARFSSPCRRDGDVLAWWPGAGHRSKSPRHGLRPADGATAESVGRCRLSLQCERRLVPCVTAQWVTAATRLTSGGMPLLLQDSQAVCMPNGTPVNIVVTQIRVKGM
jgi:hypothetical protein